MGDGDLAGQGAVKTAPNLQPVPTCRWAMGLALTSAWVGALFASCKSRANPKKDKKFLQPFRFIFRFGRGTLAGSTLPRGLANQPT